MRNLLEWLNNEPRQRIGVRVCQATIGLVFVFRASTELQYADYLYIFEYSDKLPYFLLLFLGVCGLFLVLNLYCWWATAGSVVSFNIVVNTAPIITDGGDNITTLVLMYMLLLIPYGKEFKPKSLRVWLHNLGVVAIGLQVMIMNFTAGFYKVMGESWTGGIALFKVSQSDIFSLPFMYEIFKDPYLTTFSAYATIIFLIWFPIAMFSKIKLLWLVFGVCFHLGIISFMGLITFGLVMIGMELFFITDKEYGKIIDQLKYFIEEVKKFGKNRASKKGQGQANMG